MPSLVSIKLLCNFVEITLRHGCSPVKLLHIIRTLFPKNTSGGLLLNFYFNASQYFTAVDKKQSVGTKLISNFLTIHFFSTFYNFYRILNKIIRKEIMFSLAS